MLPALLLLVCLLPHDRHEASRLLPLRLARLDMHVVHRAAAVLRGAVHPLQLPARLTRGAVPVVDVRLRVAQLVPLLLSS